MPSRTGLSWQSEGRFPEQPDTVSYTTVATGGTTHSKAVTGYVTTATYRGDVSKSEISKVECAVTYVMPTEQTIFFTLQMKKPE